MILGALVVIVIGVLLFNYFRGVGKKVTLEVPGEETEIELVEGAPEVQPTPVEPLPASYKVQKGDHLWKIAEKFYGSGYNWVDIVKENSLSSGNLLAVAQELTIPDVSVREPTVELPKTGAVASQKIIGGKNYVVEEGDSLWNIAVRAYQDGFKWAEIAQANDLANPDLIHPGNVLELPR